LLTSKEIIEKTGISRATLNNYIASGLVPRPQVLAPGPDDGDAPRIGYFPDDTIERIEVIQRLKREGWSIGRIAGHFLDPQATGAAGAAQALPAASVGPTAAPASTAVPQAQPDPQPDRRPAAPALPAGARAAPAITPVAILFSTLEDAPTLWVRLSALEYFELVNEVWAELDRIFRDHGGLLGRHPDEGLVSYFLPRRDRSHVWDALTAAQEARLTMRLLSRRWQQRKGWDVELNMNTGIDEGQDWLGTVGAAGDVRVLGEAAYRAEQLSRISHGGTILVTRSLVGKLTTDQRRRLHFGVPRPGIDDAKARLLLSFARLQDLAPAGSVVPPGVAGLAVTELLDPPIPTSGPVPGESA
jgi:class 3 adenylate cyclase/DNA-binding transcriptional MerR regulator